MPDDDLRATTHTQAAAEHDRWRQQHYLSRWERAEADGATTDDLKE